MPERREVQGVTIDGPTSKDLDDAIWIEQQEGRHVVSVTIADVASTVTQGTPLDQVAFEKSRTRYFATDNDPMLPRELSEDLLSLWQGQERKTVTITVALDEDLAVRDVRIEPTRLVSQRKFTYEEVDRVLTDSSHPWHEMLARGTVLAQALLERRRQRGALAIYDLNHGWATTEDGALIKLALSDLHAANILIQELMILANETVARFVAEHQIPALFRNHTANPSAPKQYLLMEDITNAVLHPEAFDISVLQARINIVLNRATYGPVLRGHYGLNLPAYLHFTSPIRRYADLVNQRALFAALRGEPYPYSMAELEAIADHLNAVEKEIKDQKGQSFKRQQLRETSHAIRMSTTTAMSANDFERVIKMAVEQKRMNWRLEQDILQRLRTDQLSVRDLCHLAIETKDAGQLWHRIKQEVISYVKDHPHHAPSIFGIAHSVLGWQVPRLETTRNRQKSHDSFATIARISFADEAFSSRQCRASHKKRSEQMALVSLLAKVAEVDDEDTGEVPDGIPEGILEDSQRDERTPERRHEMPVQRPKPARNFKGLLQELCQKRRWGLPWYAVSEEGEPNRQRFIITAEVQTDKELYRSDSVETSDKRDGEQYAAMDLLKKFADQGFRTEDDEVIIPASSVPEIRNDPPRRNFKGKLHELCQKRGWDIPVYEMTQAGPPHMPYFTCVASLGVADAIYRSSPVTHRDRRAAEQFASGDVLEQVENPKIAPITVASQGTVVNSSRSEERPKENFKGKLYEFCQRRGYEIPVFSCAKEGPDHQPLFTVTAEVVIAGSIYLSDPVTHRDRKAAEQLAAQQLVRRFSDFDLVINPGEGSVVAVIKDDIPQLILNAQGVEDYVSSLNEFCARRHLRMPHYAFRNTIRGDVAIVICTCRIMDRFGKWITASAEAYDQKAAKHQVARQIFEQMR